jgi:hypothetical protein
MLVIQLGVAGSSPRLGRFCHCLAAIIKNRIPIAPFS